MTLKEAMEQRHSVRNYKETALSAGTKNELNAFIQECNKEGGLHIQLVTDEPKAFGSMMAHYGKFSGVKNYVAMIGAKSSDLDEKCGYYGEKIVLKAQQMGLNTCWVAMTYKKIKTAFQVGAGEKLCVVIAIGYGATQGIPHRSKPMPEVTQTDSPMPEWFQNGMEAALLAPTAMNQQKFTFTRNGNTVTAKAGRGFYSKIDLGIAKYHFEVGAGEGAFQWKK